MIRLLWKTLISLKFAIVIMTGLTISMIVATSIESLYDFKTAVYFVYHTWWFYLLLFLLGLLILCVALSRLPWKKKHIPFLTAHFGIIILLYGSWLTDRFGIDGSLSFDEGTSESTVELDEPVLVLADDNKVKTIPLPWIPPSVEFKPIPLPEYGITVDRWITHATPDVKFVSSEAGISVEPAIQLNLKGGASAPPFMRMGQDYWIWSGEPTWKDVRAGGARLTIANEKEKDPVLVSDQPTALFRIVHRNSPKQALKYKIQSSEGKMIQGNLPFQDPKELVGKVITTNWKFDVQLTLLEVIPQANSEVQYTPSRIQYGMQTTPPAIRLKANNQETSVLWLGHGERASFETQGKEISIGFFNRRIVLPFALSLHRFNIERYQGSMNPKEFSSLVSVVGGKDEKGEGRPQNMTISMNEPLKWGGFTFYQSSYIDAEPRPVTSILSVNQDPGRWLKYLGSLMIVFGTIHLFLMKQTRRSKTKGLKKEPKKKIKKEIITR